MKQPSKIWRRVNEPISLKSETISSFDLAADEYIDSDENWGDDTYLAGEIGKRLNVLKNRLNDVPDSSLPQVRLLYAGCGPGFLLRRIMDYKDVFSIMVGVDLSRRMLRLSKLLAKEHELKNRVVFLCDDFQRDLFPEGSFDLIVCMNNTLGNLVNHEDSPSTARRKCLETFHRVLDKNGYLVLTVYNAAMYQPVSRYSRFLTLDKDKSDLKNYDLILKFRRGTGIAHSFYAHWFRESELQSLLKQSGFKIERLAKQKKRILISARK